MAAFPKDGSSGTISIGGLGVSYNKDFVVKTQWHSKTFLLNTLMDFGMTQVVIM